MLKNIKKYIPKRKYRERSQNERRKKLGLLQKKADYKIRAEDYHKKEERYKKLKELARTRNPDEFYHKMTKAKIIDGEHVQFAEDKSLQDKIVSNTQFINLVNFKKSQIENETMKMKVALQSNANMFMKGNKHSQHVLFYDDEDEMFMAHKRKRSLDEVNDDNESENNNNNTVDKEKLAKFKQKIKNVKQLTAISKGLQEQKELLPNAKRYKDSNGMYKYFTERKR